MVSSVVEPSRRTRLVKRMDVDRISADELRQDSARLRVDGAVVDVDEAERRVGAAEVGEPRVEVADHASTGHHRARTGIAREQVVDAVREMGWSASPCHRRILPRRHAEHRIPLTRRRRQQRVLARRRRRIVALRLARVLGQHARQRIVRDDGRDDR